MDPGDKAAISSSSLLPPPPPLAGSMAEKKPRRRAREVSSRYMLTPSSSPSSESPSASPRSDYPPPPSSSVFSFPKKHLPHPHTQPRRTPSSSPDTAAALSDNELERSFPDENQPLGSSSSTVRRSLDTPMLMSALQGKSIPGNQTAKKRAGVRLFTDLASATTDQFQHLPPPLPLPPPPASSDEHPNFSKTTTDFKKRAKPPGASMPFTMDHRTMAATPRSNSVNQNILRSAKVASSAARRTNPRPLTPARPNLFVSDEDKGNNISNNEALLEEHAFSDCCSSSNVDCSDWETCSSNSSIISSQGGLCDSPPLPRASRTRMRSSIDVRSSMPAADQLPIMMSTRRAIEGGSTCRKDGVHDSSSSACRSSTNSMFVRSLNSAFSSSQQQHSAINLISRPPPPGVAVGSLKPPPSPFATTKLGMEYKKVGKKAVQQEDIHMLRLQDNCYVQWRFINAKASTIAQSRTVAAQRSLYGLQNKTLELQTSCMEKKIELQQLTRQERLLSIVNNQMPYLDEWITVEEDYSVCLSGATKALQDASIRLPIVGIKADLREMNEVVHSATLILDSLTASVGSSLTNIVGIENKASDLANLLSKEKTLIEECGQLLLIAHNMQVTECSLRSQLLQLKANQQVK